MNTTISISSSLREEIKEFGQKGETYEDVIVRLLKSAKERQIQDILMDTTNCVPIEDALAEAKKKWRK
jgi:predicted CopG family antitoxin